MHIFQNKKTQVKGFLITTILLTAAFVLIISIWQTFQGKVGAKEAEAICKGSVALREKSYTEIYDPATGKLKIGSVATPLLCRTLDKYIPENKDASKEDIKREISDLMTKCWNQFGEGLIEDVFKEGDSITKNCFICYNVNLRETYKFKGEIKSDELLQYMFETPYKASTDDDRCKITGGFCIDSENTEDCSSKISADPSYLLIDKKNDACVKKNKKSCCYTEYECWNKGSICSSTNPDGNLYNEYSSWDCPSKMKCFIKKENYNSYVDYIQKFGGPGNIIVPTNIKPGETYAISFGSPTGQCSWCTKFGFGTGAGAVALALYLGVPTGGIGTVGVLVVSGIFGAGYLGGKTASEYAVDNMEQLFERDINTIYLTTLNDALKEERCNIIEDIRND